ncbi:MAG: exopolysaccharide biosynthesis polyprenyl glycosylphosphotransferase [Patescibacteria group bacterium]
MNIRSKYEPIILFLGDAILFYGALWLTLFVRYAETPSMDVFSAHFAPFSILFAIWTLVFYAAGLYEKYTLVLQSRLPSLIFYAHLSASAIAIAFFYLAPFFGITPKTNLFLFIVLSFFLILAWRVRGAAAFGARRRQNAILIGSGEEMRELYREVNSDPSYNLYFITSFDLAKLDGVDFEEDIVTHAYGEDVRAIVVDMNDERTLPILPHLYNLIFSGIRFVDMHDVYEEVFDRVPLSLLGYGWFMKNISFSAHIAYDALKRATDIVFSFVGAVGSLAIYPFVYAAIKADDGGPLFFIARRVGRNNKEIRLIKFRSMSVESTGGGIEEKPHVTRAGNFLRRTRIDEIPQLWNVLKGDISLVGPRPETPELVKVYEKEVPYYDVRHLIKPGLSGWAQIYHDAHPHHGADVTETAKKLSYDLYYIKNRSFLLDIKIVLKTVKIFAMRAGR